MITDTSVPSSLSEEYSTSGSSSEWIHTTTAATSHNSSNSNSNHSNVSNTTTSANFAIQYGTDYGVAVVAAIVGALLI